MPPKPCGNPTCTFENMNCTKDYKDSNPYDHIQFLNEHTDIVRVFTKIDDNRFASASDDGKVVIWDVNTGESTFVMEGHTNPVTCMLLLDQGILVTGSVDRTLRLWDTSTGKCVKVVGDSYGGIKCVVAVGKDKFCSGGNDKYLRVWTNSGERVGEIARMETEENLNCMLAISNEKVITASDSHLLVYQVDTLRFYSKFFFLFHREPVRCLAKINEETFVSGSLDGVIVVWQTESLSPLRKLYFPDTFFLQSENLKYYTESVNHLLVLGKRYMAACIDKGFKIYDIWNGDCVMDCPSAHDSTVTSIISVGFGTQFVTAGADAQLKLWGSEKNFNFVACDDDEPDSRTLRKKKVYYPPVCLGEMSGHTDLIEVLIKLSENAFASGAHDNNIVLWKDGQMESISLNNDALYSMMQQDNFQRAVDNMEFISEPQIESGKEEYHYSDPIDIVIQEKKKPVDKNDDDDHDYGEKIIISHIEPVCSPATDTKPCNNSWSPGNLISEIRISRRKSDPYRHSTFRNPFEFLSRKRRKSMNTETPPPARKSNTVPKKGKKKKNIVSGKDKKKLIFKNNI